MSDTKRGFSLGLRIAIMLVLGVNLISISAAIYISYVYQKLVMKEFQERILTLGENISQLAAQPIYDIQNYKKKDIEKKTRAMKSQLKTVLDAAVKRKDIIYAIIRQNGKILSEANSLKNTGDFKQPEKKSASPVFKGKAVFEVTLQNRKLYEIKFPVEYGSADMVLFLSTEIGEVNLGFDMEGVQSAIKNTRTKAVLIALAGSLLVSLLMLAYMYLHVIRPVKRVSDISKKISGGEVGENIQIIDSGDEIGVLTKSFHEMSDYINIIASVSEAVSNGEIKDGFSPKSGKDALGTAFVKMLKYINEVSELIERVAKGELGRTFTAKSEKDRLGRACAEMAESLKNLVLDIKKQADFMAGSSKQLTGISENSQQTTSQLAETIASISAATAESAEKAQSAAHSSKLAEESARQGTKKMNALLEKIQVLNSEIEASSESMHKLSQHSEEIKNLMSIIRSVAEETKLLSFNAAIEAARAGESGRGFAVVAEEIRKLSEMTSEQVGKINDTIKVIRVDIASAVETAGREINTMRESSDLTNETNVIFTDIVKFVDETAAQMESVAAAAQEISASSEQASASSQEQASAIEELNTMVAEFTETSRALKQSTDKFTI